MSLLFKTPSLAYIRAQECIGCTKCIEACPFDAILGASKHLHTVLVDKCVGCGLCVEPCPVDCIDMHPVTALVCQPDQAKQQVKAKKQRLRKLEAINLTSRDSFSASTVSSHSKYVKAALERAKIKRKE